MTAEDREARLAAALRANLRRRKAARSDPSEPPRDEGQPAGADGSAADDMDSSPEASRDTRR